jgi:hypothetical protein
MPDNGPARSGEKRGCPMPCTVLSTVGGLLRPLQELNDADAVNAHPDALIARKSKP